MLELMILINTSMETSVKSMAGFPSIVLNIKALYFSLMDATIVSLLKYRNT